MKKISTILICLFILQGIILADGLLMPIKENYPKNFLKNRSTEVIVNIFGITAETFVTQEFVNEWYDSTDAVYSFPLPEDARATEFVYWYKDKPYKAVLKVKEQAANPGTGEGGIAALVNTYIGRNGIKVMLRGIAAGGIQKIMLKYISKCDFYTGKTTYKFPLNTEDFITYPVEHLKFAINVYSNEKITSFGLPSHDNVTVLDSASTVLKLEMVKPKAYLNKDLEFYYTTDRTDLGVDFYSIASDTMDGHFALFIRPQDTAVQDSVLPKRIVFLLSNSSGMYGSKLTLSIEAISKTLDMLTPKDQINIAVFNWSVNLWKTSTVPATPENITSAKAYLAGVSSLYGTDLNLALKECFKQFTDKAYANVILLFSDGQSPLNIADIESKNTNNTGVFPVAFGNPNRARLETIAGRNYGFVTYIGENDAVNEKIQRLFQLISQPVMTEVSMEYGRADLNNIMPSKLPSTYAGSYFYTVGRYKNSGESALVIAGKSISGERFFNFRLNFSAYKDQPKFVETLWAKEMIDALERKIEIEGETPADKQQLIDLSLKYNIRCRYTAYVADYETEWPTEVEQEKTIVPVSSYIAGNYPNPFNPSTKIRIYIDQSAAGKVKFVKIYNCLGQLVAVIDISDLREGWNEVIFNAVDMSGNHLASGIYLVRLEISGVHAGVLKINLIK